MSFNIKKSLEVDYLAARIISSRDYATNVDASAGHVLTAMADGKAQWQPNLLENTFQKIILPDISYSTIVATNISSLYEFQLQVSDPLTLDIVSSLNRIIIGTDLSNFISTPSLTSTVEGLGNAGYASTSGLAANYYTYVTAAGGPINVTSNLRVEETIGLTTVQHPVLNTWAEDMSNMGTIGDGATYNIDCLWNNYSFITPGGGSFTLNFPQSSASNIPDGKVFGINFWITNGNNASPTSITYTGTTLTGGAASFKWPGSIQPTLSGTDGRIDIINLVTYDRGSNWLGFSSGSNYY